MRTRLFENLVESGLEMGGGRRLGALPLSLAAHALILTAAAAGPLLFSAGPLPEPARTVRQVISVVPSLLPAPPPASRDEPAPRPGTSRATGSRVPAPTSQADAPTLPSDAGSDLPDAAPSTESFGTGMWLGDVGPAAHDGQGLSGAPSAPVRVGREVKEPRKLKHVAPGYPEIAKAARVQGVVELECVIDERGRVRDIKVLKGVPLLDQAAVDAVRQWVYTPTLLGGVPVAVIMTVTVNFRLS